MAHEISRITGVPHSVAASVAIGVCSGAIGGGLRIRTYRGDTGANLYSVIVVDSGSGKDLSLRLALRPLETIEQERIEHWERVEKPELEARLREVRAQFSALEKAMKDGGGQVLSRRLVDAEKRRAEIERQLRAEPQLLVADCTKEKLMSVMEGQPGEAIFSVSAEARGILKVIAGRYSKSSDEDVYLAGYSGTPMKSSRIGRKTVNLRKPCLAVLFMVQPDALHRFANNPEMVESGFLPRFLAFDARAEPQLIPEETPIFDPDLERGWHELIETLVNTYRDSVEGHAAQMEPDALQHLREYANETTMRFRTGGDLADVSAFAARWAENACRVALVLHAAEHGNQAHSHPLTLETARRARRLVEWYAAEALDLFGGIRETKRVERRNRLVEILENSPDWEKSLRDLRKSHGFDNATIEAYAAEGWLKIERIQNPGGGRPTMIARLVHRP
jgi:hypothetical protein